MRYFISIFLLLLFLLKIDAGFSMGKSPSIEHSITYSNKGTRSEAKHGHLFIHGKEIPDIFTLVFYREQVFKFHQRTQLWGNDGYFAIEGAQGKIILKESSAEIGRDSLSRGWYNGKEKLSGTPANWLYVEWDEGTAFLTGKN